jgi:hypothetical protein
MSAPNIPAVLNSDFSATAAAEGRSLNLSLSGNADFTIKTSLDQFLLSSHEEARRLQVEEVVVDLRQLEFMNSSCLKSLVLWINQVQAMEPAERYRITFLSSPTVYWQKRSLHALSCLATDLVTLQS